MGWRLSNGINQTGDCWVGASRVNPLDTREGRSEHLKLSHRKKKTGQGQRRETKWQGKTFQYLSW